MEIFQKILNFIVTPDKITLIDVFIRLVLATLIGGIIGSERGKHGSAAGLRTHILVCLGSAMTSLTGIYLNLVFGMGNDVTRIAAQVISGIGFLGAGMIVVKSSNIITGLTTAAGMWTTATIGIALGYGFYSGALIGMLACVFTAAFLTRLERKRKMSIHIYTEINEISRAGDIADEIRKLVCGEILLETAPPKSGINGNIALHITLSKMENSDEIRHEIEKIQGICFVIAE